MGLLREHLSTEDVLLDVCASSQRQVFDRIGRHMQAHHAVAADAVARALQRREMAGSTALGRGFAIPHAMVPGLDRIFAVYLRLARPLPFDAGDGEPVADLIVLLVPAPARQAHLELLAQVAALCVDSGFRQALHDSRDAADVKALFDSWRPACPRTRQ